MKRPQIIVLALGLSLAASAQAQSEQERLLGQLLGGSKIAKPASGPAANISNAEAGSGMKLALSKATDVVVRQLGAPGGFANDPKVRIGLPGQLGKYEKVLSLLDSAGVTDNLSGKLNAAAEGAVGKAGPLLKTAISQMTVSDAVGIVTGGPTSATDYFKRTMGKTLQAQMRPVVAKSLSGVNAFKALNSFTAKNQLPVGRFGAADLTGYVTQKTADGVFYYMGEHEKQIRANPAGAGSALITKVFGGR